MKEIKSIFSQGNCKAKKGNLFMVKYFQVERIQKLIEDDNIAEVVIYINITYLIECSKYMLVFL